MILTIILQYTTYLLALKGFRKLKIKQYILVSMIRLKKVHRMHVILVPFFLPNSRQVGDDALSSKRILKTIVQLLDFVPRDFFVPSVVAEKKEMIFNEKQL